MSHPINKVVDQIIDMNHQPNRDGLTDFVEWVVVHKGCGRPLTGMSPKAGWCRCDMATGLPPEMPSDDIYMLCPRCNCTHSKKVAEAPVESPDLLKRAEKAELEVVKLREKLEKAGKIIADLKKHN